MKYRLAVVQKDLVILTEENGKQHQYSNKEYDLVKVVKELQQANWANGVIELDMNNFLLTNVVNNSFAEASKKTGIGFFKRIGNAIKNLLTKEELPPETMLKASDLEEDEVIALVTSSEDELSPEEIPSLINTPEPMIVRDVAPLVAQVANANKTGEYEGLTNLLKRMGEIQRNHTTKDLVTFLEKSELPISKNGDIIAYKRLNRKNHHFVDCHTGNVPQVVGSVVAVDLNQIDMDRSRECSGGLHIARRAYLKGFGGDVTTIVLVRPEDVYVVPHKDADKVRVSQYQILGVLSATGHREVNDVNKEFSNDQDRLLIQSALDGYITPAKEMVKIGGPWGTNLTITKLDPVENVIPSKPVKAPEKVSIQDTVVEVSKKIKPTSVDLGSTYSKQQLQAIELIKQGGMSDRKIASIVGLTHQSVGRLRKKISN